MTLFTVFTHVLAAAAGSGATFAFVHKKAAAATKVAGDLAVAVDAAAADLKAATNKAPGA